MAPSARTPAASRTSSIVAAAIGLGVLASVAPLWSADTTFEADVPGGTAALARAAGLDPATEAWRLLPDLTRRLHVSFGERAAARTRAQMMEALQGRETPPASTTPPAAAAPLYTTAPSSDGDDGPVLLVPAAPPTPPPSANGVDRVPIPLSAAAWHAILGLGKGSREREVLSAIAGDGAAARLFRGLATLDAPTLGALASDTGALREIYRRHSDAFATFAASFRVENDRVAVPGGAEEAVLWQDLVGASVMQPGRFLADLAAADQGRLFFFYDAVDRLDEAHQRFALAATERDGARRQERIRALRAVFAAAEPWWDANHLPFSRPVADAARVLETARVMEDGTLASPRRQVLWLAAFEDQTDATAEWRARLEQSPAADAAWLVERIATADSNVGRSRLAMLAFAQRALADPESADAADLLAALRGFGRYRALALALERIGIREVALHAAAERQAERLEHAGHGERGRTSLAEFQGALALVERARSAGSLDSAAAARLVWALVDTKLEDGRYGDRIAEWIRGQLVPLLRLHAGRPEAAGAEDVVLRAMAGQRAAAKPFRLEWEGLSYDVDPAAAEHRRLMTIRRRQGGPTLDDALSAPAADRESRLASVLIDLAYAAALGPAESASAASEDVARRHDFAFEEPEMLGGPRAAWAVPSEAGGVGQRWHAQGALLGLDLGLARVGLRRLETDVPPMPVLTAADRRGFAESAALVRASGLSDAGRDAIAAALRRGRERLAAAAADPARMAALAASIRVRDWRRGALPWIAAHDPAHLEAAFSLDELYWLGAGAADEATSAIVAPWGASGRWEDGCLCLRLRPPVPFDALSGRTADGRLAALAPDLHLRIAELMSEMALPSALAPAILTFATQDLMDGAAPAYVEDGLAVSRFARGLTRRRMEDYVAALAGRGPLLPAEAR